MMIVEWADLDHAAGVPVGVHHLHRVGEGVVPHRELPAQLVSHLHTRDTWHVTRDAWHEVWPTHARNLALASSKDSAT